MKIYALLPWAQIICHQNLHQVSNQFFLDHDRSLPQKTLRKTFSFFKQKSNVYGKEIKYA